MLRTLMPEDLERVHQLNQAAVPDVGSATREHLADLVAMASEAMVAEVDGGVVGFLIALGPGCAYDSPNYQFFEVRHADFAYIDRIAIDPSAHGLGLGRALYEQVIATTSAPVLCAEVNVLPRNDPSLHFHDRLGFVEVGEQDTYDGAVRVRLLERAL